VPEDYQFCRECGRQLPVKKPVDRPAQSSAQPSKPIAFVNPTPPSPTPPPPQKSLRQVDLNPSQKKALKKQNGGSALAAGGNITRMFGGIFGIAAIASALFIGSNTSLSPSEFAEFVVGVSVIAIVLSIASVALRSKSMAITRRRAFELIGEANEEALEANPVVNVEGIKFLKTPVRVGFTSVDWSANIRINTINRLVFVTKGVMSRGRQPILFLGINETNFDWPIPGAIVASGYSGKGTLSAAKKAGGRLGK